MQTFFFFNYKASVCSWEIKLYYIHCFTQVDAKTIRYPVDWKNRCSCNPEMHSQYLPKIERKSIIKDYLGKNELMYVRTIWLSNCCLGNRSSDRLRNRPVRGLCKRGGRGPVSSCRKPKLLGLKLRPGDARTPFSPRKEEHSWLYVPLLLCVYPDRTAKVTSSHCKWIALYFRILSWLDFANDFQESILGQKSGGDALQWVETALGLCLLVG